jgi:hypothetical protein
VGIADVEVHVESWDSWGSYACILQTPFGDGTGCQFGKIWFNSDLLTAGGQWNDEAAWKYLGCHEFAHSVGAGEWTVDSDPYNSVQYAGCTKMDTTSGGAWLSNGNVFVQHSDVAAISIASYN